MSSAIPDPKEDKGFIGNIVEAAKEAPGNLLKAITGFASTIPSAVVQSETARVSRGKAVVTPEVSKLAVTPSGERISSTEAAIKGAEGVVALPLAGMAPLAVPYRELISRPLSTAFLAANADYRSDVSWATGDDDILNLDLWKLAYQNAKFVSPGQAIVGSVGAAISGENGTDKINWASETEVKDYFSRGPQKYVSFGLDFITSYRFDPYYLAGRGVGRLQRSYISRPVTTKTMPVLLDDIDKGVAGEQNAFRKIIDTIKANADDINAIEDLDVVARSASAGEFAKVLGAAAKLAVRTGDDSFIGNAFKVALGNEPARLKLTEQSPQLAADLDRLKSQKASIENYLKSNKKTESIQDPKFMAPLGVKGQFTSSAVATKQHEQIVNEIKEVEDRTSLLDSIIANDEKSIFASIQNQTWSTSAKLELSKLKKSLTFTEAYWDSSKAPDGSRIVRWLNPSVALREKESGIARIAGIVSDRARFEARARVRTLMETAGVSAKEAKAIYNSMFETTNKATRFKWFDDLQNRNIVGIINKRVSEVGGKPLSAEENKLLEGIALEIAKASSNYQRQTLVRLVNTNYTINDGFGTDNVIALLKDYVEEIAKDIAANSKRATPNAADYDRARKVAADLLSDVPTTETQVPTLHIGIDMRMFDDIIKENSTALKLLVNDMRANPGLYDNQGIGAVKKTFDTRIQQLLSNDDNVISKLNDDLNKYSDLLTGTIDSIYSQIWKPATLMSFKYTTRNVGEGWWRVLAVATEYARDTGGGITKTLFGAYERGVIRRGISNTRERQIAFLANRQLKNDRIGLTDEQLKLEKDIYNLTFTSTDSLTANVSEIGRYSSLVTARYGSIPSIDRTPLTNKILNRFQSLTKRLEDNTGLSNEESKELYDALLSGNLDVANNIILSAREESVVFNTLRTVQDKIRKEIDFLDDITNNKQFKNEPVRLQKYVNGSIDSYKDIDTAIQNIAQLALTRAQSRGKLESLIVAKAIGPKIKKAGQGEFELIPGLKMSGYREGVVGQIMSKEISAAQSSTRTILDSTRLSDSSLMQRSTVEDIINPTDPNWAEAAADFANRHIGDRFAQRIVNGDSFEEALKWARSNAKDAKAWRAEKQYDFNRYRVQGVKDPLKGFATEINVLVNNILPTVGIDGQIIRPLIDDAGNVVPGLRQLASQGKLKAEDMLTIPEKQRASVEGTTVIENTATINGKQVNTGSRFWTWHRRNVDKIFKYIGTLPEDNLVRHPFYNMIYKAETRRQANLLKSQGLDLKQIESRIPEISINAHKFAYKSLMERLYSIERYTDPAYVMRFVSPFYMAKQNSNRFWFGYAMRNPQAAAKYFMIYQSPAKVFSVEDENGREIKTINPFNAQDATIKVVLPESIAKFYGKDIPGDTVFNISISQLDLINNGTAPLVPELGGFLVDVPVGTILLKASGTAYDPELLLANLGVDPEFLRKRVIPYYKDQAGFSKGDVLLSMIFQAPSWVRKLAANEIPVVSSALGIFNPKAVDQFNTRVVNVYKDRFAEWDANRDPFNPEPLTPEVRERLLTESVAIAGQMNIAEAIFAGTGIIVAPRLTTQQEELRKELRLYQDEAIKNGGTADDGLYNFVKKYGYERAGVAQFTPREMNPYGFLSTPQTLRNLNKHSQPFSRAFAEVGPTKVAGAMLNAGDPVEDYSTLANSKLYTSNASGIGAVKARLTDREEMQRELEINQGYKLQFEYKNYYDASVAAGTMTQKQADAAYKAAKQDIARRYPAYESASGIFDVNKAQNNVKAIFFFLGDEAYVNDVVKKNKLQGAVYDFMVEREALVQQRLNIDSNPDAQIDSAKFNSVNASRAELVKKISAEVPEFADFFKYYLENDPLSFSSEIARLK